MDVVADNEATWEACESLSWLISTLENAEDEYGCALEPNDKVELIIDIPWWYDDTVLDDLTGVAIKGRPVNPRYLRTR